MPISLRWLTIAECISLLIFVLACLYISYFLLSGSKQNIALIEVPVQRVHKEQVIEIPSVQPYTSYAAKITKRDIFSSSIDTTDLENKTVVTGVLPSHLKVVGIIIGKNDTGDKPAEIILEDTNAHETIFIKQGKEQNGISIQKVDANQVILNYQGQAVAIPIKENIQHGS